MVTCVALQLAVDSVNTLYMHCSVSKITGTWYKDYGGCDPYMNIYEQAWLKLGL